VPKPLEGGERVGLMIELAKAYAAQGMRTEAEKALADAQRDVADTATEGRLTVRSCSSVCAFRDLTVCPVRRLRMLRF